MFCEKCGNKYDADALFCPVCGARTDVPSTPPAPAAASGKKWKAPAAVMALLCLANAITVFFDIYIYHSPLTNSVSKFNVIKMLDTSDSISGTAGTINKLLKSEKLENIINAIKACQITETVLLILCAISILAVFYKSSNDKFKGTWNNVKNAFLLHLLSQIVVLIFLNLINSDISSLLGGTHSVYSFTALFYVSAALSGVGFIAACAFYSMYKRSGCA